MTNFWFVILMSSLFYICTFLPMGLFYAESDEGKAFVRQQINFLGIPILLSFQTWSHFLVHSLHCTFFNLRGMQIYVHSDLDLDMWFGQHNSHSRSHVWTRCRSSKSLSKQHKLLHLRIHTGCPSWVSNLCNNVDDFDWLVFPLFLYAYWYVGLCFWLHWSMVIKTNTTQWDRIQ